jgi:dephospho-CoA kinase
LKEINDLELVIIIGKSGVGKSTFVKTLDCPKEYQYEMTILVRKDLKREGKEINYDTIVPMCRERYGENPYWQVPYILKRLREKKFLILDGLRSVEEIKRLIELVKNTLVVNIKVEELERKRRLKKRDDVDSLDSSHIKESEDRVAQLETFANITITNDGSLTELEKKAASFKKFLEFIKDKTL